MAHNSTDIVVLPEVLEEQIVELLRCAGMADQDSSLTAQLVVRTNLWGIDSHGALRVPTYIRRLQAGAINASASPTTVRSGGALEVLDGQDGIGFVVGHAAMVAAIELATKHGVGIVGAINSNHFGAAGLYARLAADSGLVGIAMTNVAPNVVAPGGSRPVTGNNPLAIALPTHTGIPFTVDISFSAVSGGKLLLASKKGERIPFEWATDSSGRPTDDPDAGFAGFLLPMGGFKGLGMAYAIDALCGVITGGLFGTDLKGTYSQPLQASKTSHLMLAIDTSAFMAEEELQARMAQFTQMIKSSPMRNPQDEMLLPGEPEYRSAIQRANGIPLPATLFDELIELADELGARVTLPPRAG